MRKDADGWRAREHSHARPKATSMRVRLGAGGGRRGGMVAEGVPRFGLREFRGTERGAKQAKACKRKEKEWRNQQEKPQEGGRLAASNGST